MFNPFSIVEPTVSTESEVEDPSIYSLERYAPSSFGLAARLMALRRPATPREDLPERLFRQVYVEDAELKRSDGWQTGRASQPAFMDMTPRRTHL